MHRFNIQGVEKWNYEKLFLSPVLKQEGIFYNKVQGKNTLHNMRYVVQDIAKLNVTLRSILDNITQNC